MPQLKLSGRSREFEAYDPQARGKIIYGWLFKGEKTRAMDKSILCLDPKVSKGWQAHGILRFLGLDAEFKNIFSGLSIDQAIQILSKDAQDFSLIIEHLGYATEEFAVGLAELQQQELQHLKAALADSSEVRKLRLAKKKGVPQRIRVFAYTYIRNADVTAEALCRAGGVCEVCNRAAPFIRDSDGTPYLEVHHVVPLHSGGADDLNNVVAVCPNCHREKHFGKNKPR